MPGSQRRPKSRTSINGQTMQKRFPANNSAITVNPRQCVQGRTPARFIGLSCGPRNPSNRTAIARKTRAAGMFDAGAGQKGGMRVSVVGNRSDGGDRVRRTCQLTAPAMDGPEIPCMAAIILARRLARGEVFQSGAFPCMGFLILSEFAPEFARWKITTRMEEVAA